jgi:hypothetical protein
MTYVLDLHSAVQLVDCEQRRTISETSMLQLDVGEYRRAFAAMVGLTVVVKGTIRLATFPTDFEVATLQVEHPPAQLK